MTETEMTPVRLAAEAMEDAAMRYLGRDLGTIYRDKIAQAGLAAIPVEGMAAEIGRHWLTEPSHAYGGARHVTRSCNCGRALEPQFFEWRHSQEMTQHEAEAVKAWLTGGGA